MQARKGIKCNIRNNMRMESNRAISQFLASCMRRLRRTFLEKRSTMPRFKTSVIHGCHGRKPSERREVCSHARVYGEGRGQRGWG